MWPFKEKKKEINPELAFELGFSEYGEKNNCLIEDWFQERDNIDAISLKRSSNGITYEIIINDLRLMLPGTNFQNVSEQWKSHFQQRFGAGALEGSITFAVEEDNKKPKISYISFLTLYKISHITKNVVSAIEPRTYIDLERKCAVGMFPKDCSPREILQSQEIISSLETLAYKYLPLQISETIH